MSAMTDQELWDKIAPLYDQEISIRKISKLLGSSHHRVRRLLIAHGIDTGLRKTVFAPPTEEHPFSLFDVMTEKNWTNGQIALRVGVTKETVVRWKRTGLTYDRADELALAMGDMPQDLWDHWWDFDDEPSLELAGSAAP